MSLSWYLHVIIYSYSLPVCFFNCIFCSGPYGIRLLNETLMWHVGSQVQELKKLVLQNKEALVSLRTNFDKPDVMKDLAKRLVQVDSVLQVRRVVTVNSVIDKIPTFKLCEYNFNRKREWRINFKKL